jgi:peptide/nickel transport system substrate-binding protein
MADNPRDVPEGFNALSLSRRQLLTAAGGAVLAGTLAACGSSGSSSSSAGGSAAGSGAAGTPKPGGDFRLGVTGGGSGDIIDGQSIVTKPDQARLVAGWDTLLEYDKDYKLQQTGLAQEVTQDAPDVWTIKLRDGIQFHDGKPLTADDVVYSINRILNPDEGLFGSAGLASIDPKQIKKMDNLTVRLKLKQPDSTIGDQLGQYYNGIVPVGYTRKGKQIGTGPYTLKSFTPGQQSVHEKNPNYWRTGEPHFDQVTVIDFPDPNAQVNALRSGQIDAMTDIPFGQIEVAKQAGLTVLESQGGGWLPLCMAIDLAPFDDPLVRQAFRLMADREQLLQQVLSGHGRVANDLYSPFDACFDTSLPQRQQDLEQAKSLLKQAGHENLSVELVTAPVFQGIVEAAQVFAQQAKGAGVDVKVRKVDSGTFYGDNYLKWPFAQDFWATRAYLSQVAQGDLPNSPFNETHWKPPQFVKLIQQARAELDDTKRAQILHDAQKMQYDEGGYIIQYFSNIIDAYSAKIGGFAEAKCGFPFGNYWLKNVGFVAT